MLDRRRGNAACRRNVNDAANGKCQQSPLSTHNAAPWSILSHEPTTCARYTSLLPCKRSFGYVADKTVNFHSTVTRINIRLNIGIVEQRFVKQNRATINVAFKSFKVRDTPFILFRDFIPLKFYKSLQCVETLKFFFFTTELKIEVCCL